MTDQIFQSECLYSTLRNISGRAMRFPFIPPHGRYLENNEEVSIFGDIREVIGSGHRARQRNQSGLQDALTQNPPLLEIVSTPNPILVDAVNGTIAMLELRNDQLVSVDPCWNQSIQNSDSTQPIP